MHVVCVNHGTHTILPLSSLWTSVIPTPEGPTEHRTPPCAREVGVRVGRERRHFGSRSDFGARCGKWKELWILPGFLGFWEALETTESDWSESTSYCSLANVASPSLDGRTPVLL